MQWYILNYSRVVHYMKWTFCEIEHHHLMISYEMIILAICSYGVLWHIYIIMVTSHLFQWSDPQQSQCIAQCHFGTVEKEQPSLKRHRQIMKCKSSNLKSLGTLKGRNSCKHICPSEASKVQYRVTRLFLNGLKWSWYLWNQKDIFWMFIPKTMFDYGQNNFLKPSNLSNGIFLRDA